MADLKCTCGELYDLGIHRPKVAKCGHTACLKYIQNYEAAQGAYACYFCQKIDEEDPENFHDDPNLIKRLEHLMLCCYIHNIKALGYNVASKRGVCYLCEDRTIVPITTLETEISKQLMIDYCRNKKLLSKEFRRIIIKKFNLSLDEIAKGIIMIENYVSGNRNCRNHPSVPATKIDWNSYYIYCDNDTSMNTLTDIVASKTDRVDQVVQIYSKGLVHSSVPRLFANRSIDKLKLMIELIEMNKSSLTGLKDLACSGCQKRFRLGEHMPVLLNCSHIMCFQCTRCEGICTICRTSFSYPKSLHYDPGLYHMPQCVYCNRTSEFSRIPFHNFCDCVICDKCSKSFPYCNRCSLKNIILANNYVSVHKDILSKLLYLSMENCCEDCVKTNAVFVRTTDLKAICESCKANNTQTIHIHDYITLDNFLNSYWDQLLNIGQDFYANFPTLPMNSKRKTVFNAIQSVYEIGNFPYLGVKVLRRFKKIYPVCKNDRRIFKVTPADWIEATFRTSKHIFVLGVILAGAVSGEPIDADIHYQDEKLTQLCKKRSICYKENFVFFDQPVLTSSLSVMINFPRQCILFSGKKARDSEYSQDNITFRFDDTRRLGYDKIGPILGILYSYDYQNN